MADLRERRLDLVCENVQETARDGDLEAYRKAVERLSTDMDVADIAAAALKALALAVGPDDQYGEDIPQIAAPPPRASAPGGQGGPGPSGGPDRGDGRRRPKSAGPGWGRVFIGGGMLHGIRPGDLFGAIVNETGLPRSAVGAIEVTDRFALVEVPEDQVDRVVAALRGTKLRGQKLIVRRDRGPGGPG